MDARSRNSTVGTVKRSWADNHGSISSRVKKLFCSPQRPDKLRAYPESYSIGNDEEGISQETKGHGVNLTTHLHLVERLK
jgi:hypothetical protein